MLGVCLSVLAPAARADDGNIYVNWKFGNKGDFSFQTGYVWNGAFRDAVVSALNANDYAAFQALIGGFNEKAEIQGKKGTRYKTGCTCSPKFEGSFTNAQEFITFLYFNEDWDEAPFTAYHILEQSVGDLRYGPPPADEKNQVNAANAKNSFIHGTVGQAVASLMIATEPEGLPQTGFSPAVQTNGLTEGAAVTGAAPAEIVWNGAHYTNLNQAVVQTWDETAQSWSTPDTNGAAGGQYVYTHGAASGKITWLYDADGYQLVREISPAGAGTVTAEPEPTASSGFYTNGAIVMLTATPSEYYDFIKWETGGEEEPTNATLAVTMDQPCTVRAVFKIKPSVALTWAGGDTAGNWRAGGPGWLAADGTTPAVWVNGAIAVFSNENEWEVPLEGEVRASFVRIEGAKLTLKGEGTLTMVDAATITATNKGAAVVIDAPIAGTDGLTVYANDAEKSFVIGKPTTFSGMLAIESGRVEFGTGGMLGNKKFESPIMIAEGALLVTPAITNAQQGFSEEISGGGAVLVQNTEGNFQAAVSFKNAMWTGGLTVGAKGKVTVKRKENGLPVDGPLEVIDGGQIETRCTPLRTKEIRIAGPGSRLDFNNQAASPKPKSKYLLMEGGAITLSTKNNIELCHLTVTNGGVIKITATGDRHKPLLFKNSGTLTVRGNGVCSNAAGYVLQHADKNAAAALTLDVADGVEDADLVVSGNITGECWEKTIVKTGAGTAVFSGTNSYVCTTRINEGTLRIETDKAMGTDAPVALNGGTLELGAGDNTHSGVGTLELAANSTIRIAGGKIRFAVSRDVAWAAGAELTIAGRLGKQTVGFGTDKGGLTPAQLRKIKLEGKPNKALCLDEAGWLCEERGTAILLQ